MKTLVGAAEPPERQPSAVVYVPAVTGVGGTWLPEVSTVVSTSMCSISWTLNPASWRRHS